MEKRAEEDLVDDDDDEEEEEEGHNYNVPPKAKSPFSTKKTNKRSWNYGTHSLLFSWITAQYFLSRQVDSLLSCSLFSFPGHGSKVKSEKLPL